MKIIIKKVGQEPQEAKVKSDLKTLQSLIGGGYLRAVYMGQNVIMLCDEEGNLKKLKPNLYLTDIFPHDVIVGDVFFSADNNEGDFIDLTDSQITYIKAYCKENSIK